MEVRPAHADELEALLVGPDAFRALTGRRVEPGYSSFDGVLEHALATITTGGIAPEWSTHLFYGTADEGSPLLGIGGFKGPPADGAVEIGYEIAPTLRGRGRATAAATAMIDQARAAGCTTVLAHTLAETNPSTSALTRLGFRRTATIDDPDDGPIWPVGAPARLAPAAVSRPPGQAGPPGPPPRWAVRPSRSKIVRISAGPPVASKRWGTMQENSAASPSCTSISRSPRVSSTVPDSTKNQSWPGWTRGGWCRGGARGAS